MIHHVGVVASDSQSSRVLSTFQLLYRMSLVGYKKIGTWHCECYMYRLGTTYPAAMLELVVPYGGKLTEWLAERGVTLHHVAVQVEDVRATSRQLVASGVPLVAEEPVEGVCNTLVNFIHPRHAGIMIELVEVLPDSGTV